MTTFHLRTLWKYLQIEKNKLWQMCKNLNVAIMINWLWVLGLYPNEESSMLSMLKFNILMYNIEKAKLLWTYDLKILILYKW